MEETEEEMSLNDRAHLETPNIAEGYFKGQSEKEQGGGRLRLEFLPR